jgi:hypothetical protein
MTAIARIGKGATFRKVFFSVVGIDPDVKPIDLSVGI